MYHILLGGLQQTQLTNGLRTFTLSDGMQSSIKHKSLQVFFSPFQRKQQTLEKQHRFPLLLPALPLRSQQSRVSLSSSAPARAAAPLASSIRRSAYTTASSTFFGTDVNGLVPFAPALPHAERKRRVTESLKGPLLFDPIIFLYRITESQNGRGWKGPLWVI